MRHEINKCLWQIKHLNSTCTWHESMNVFFWNNPRWCASLFTNNDMIYKGILKNIAHFFDLYNITIIVELWTLYITIYAKKDEHRHTTPDKNKPLHAILNISVRIIFRLKNSNKRIHHIKCNIHVHNSTSTHWIEKSRYRDRQP